MDRRLIDYKPELEIPPRVGAFVNPATAWREDHGEMAFAARLLEAESPAALAAALTDLVGRAGGHGPIARPLMGVLQRSARMVFPINATRAPGDLKRKAAAIFGMELEGLSPEDKEFEVARRFVRLAGDTVEEARRRPAQEPSQAVQLALLHAARRHAPGLLRRRAQTAVPQAGRWRRQGNVIVVLEC